jgi:hypothetical protein
VFFSFDENKVHQLMSTGASLERFGERDLVFMKHCFNKKQERKGFRSMIAGSFIKSIESNHFYQINFIK